MRDGRVSTNTKCKPLAFNIVVFRFNLGMAARSYEAGFRKYYGHRLTNISDDTSDEQIRQVCDHWARDYDKVIKSYQIKSRLYWINKVSFIILSTPNLLSRGGGYNLTLSIF